MKPIETDLSRDFLAYLRAHDPSVLPERADRWRKFFATEGLFLEQWREEELAYDLRITSPFSGPHFITKVTGVEPIRAYHKPRRGEAFGGSSFRQETTAFALVRLHQLGATASPVHMIEPLVTRLAKRQMLSEEELYVLWAKPRTRVPMLFSWPKGVPEAVRNEVRVFKTFRGGLVFAFKSHKGEAMELVVPDAERLQAKTVLRVLGEHAPLLTAARLPSHIRTMARNAELPAWGKPPKRPQPEPDQFATVH